MGALAVGAIAFVGYRLWSSGFEWGKFTASLAGLDPFWLGISLLLVALTYVGRALRWAVMIRPLRPNAPLWPIFQATAIGFTAIVFFGRPGEIVRPYLIARGEKLPLSSQLAVWLLERMLDLLAVLVIFGLALSQIQASSVHPESRLAPVLQAGGWLVGITAIVALVVLFALRQFGTAAQKRIADGLSFLPDRIHSKVAHLLDSFSQGMQATRHGGFAFQLALYTILEWTIIGAAFWTLLKTMPATAGFRVQDALILLGFVAFGGVIQLPGIGGGMQIVTVIVLSELYGVGIEPATGFALLLWLATFVAIVPVGVLLAISAGLKWKNLAHIAEEAEGEVAAGEGRSS
jgi:glycosyltransferase 2 family protein